MLDQEDNDSEDLLYKVQRLYCSYCIRHGFKAKGVELLRVLLEEPLWQYQFTKFSDFVKAPYQEGGLGTTFVKLRTLANDDPDLDELLSLSAIQVILPKM